MRPAEAKWKNLGASSPQMINPARLRAARQQAHWNALRMRIGISMGKHPFDPLGTIPIKTKRVMEKHFKRREAKKIMIGATFG